jgi:diaminopimelate epimerase
MSVLTLTKHHGLGNDFLVLLDLDGTQPIDAGLARALCDRHRGIGADGLIRATRPAGGEAGGSGSASGSAVGLESAGGLGAESGVAGGSAVAGPLDPDLAAGPPTVLTFELRNADGSAAEVSGNGLRCLAQAALDAGVVPAGRPFTVLTSAGPRQVTVRPTEERCVVRADVDMGVARIDGHSQRCNVGHGELRVDLGNPHLVVLGPDPDTVAVDRLGPELERGFPGGQNVEFVALGPGPDAITMRVWERGVGETLACGSGASAAAAALHHWGRVGSRVLVHQAGGDAEVELRDDGSVVLSGPSQRIATCSVDLDGKTD